MADSLKASMDTSEWDKIFVRLQGPAKESLARQMGVAGGKVLRDEAKLRVPEETGRLKNAIYVAYNKKLSGELQHVYSVSWNRIAAPHGHLIEFGHLQPYPVIIINGEVRSLLKHPFSTPKFVPAQSFLRSAFDAKLLKAKEVMITIGRERLPIILGGENEFRV